MDSRQLDLLASILACNARIIGMQAENEARRVQGDAPTYGELSFATEAQTLEHLAQAARSWQ